MDKFINKDCDLNTGLELLANHNKIIKNRIEVSTKISQDFNKCLGRFKKHLISKINQFDPTRKRDEYDTFIRNIWIHYIIGNKTRDEYLDLYKYLGVINIDDKTVERVDSSDTNSDSVETSDN